MKTDTTPRIAEDSIVNLLSAAMPASESEILEILTRAR